MVVLILARGLQYSYAYLLNTLEKIQYRFYAVIFSVYNLVADIVLIKLFGLIGVAIATSSASLFTLIYYHYIVTRKLNIKIKYYWPGLMRSAFNTLLSLIICAAPGLLWKRNVFLSGMLFISVYGLLCYLFNPLYPDDWKTIKQLILKPKQ